MFGRFKRPKDRTRYPKSPDSGPLTIAAPAGRYVFVVDLNECVHVSPDRGHEHPKVLGNRQPALYAGELVIDPPGVVVELNNLSGTFLFRSQRSLCCVADGLRLLGFTVSGVEWYSPTGQTGPQPLTCP